MTAVLFVCTANICRSAYAELAATHRGVDGLDVGSAGTHGWPDHPVDEHMATELERRGIDPSGFRSRRLSPAMIDEADLVLTATAAHRTFVLEERPVAVRKTFSLGQLATAFGVVPEVHEGPALLAAVRRVSPTASSDQDVADPYGRGPDAASASAAHLDRLLDVVLSRLVALT